MVCLGLRGGGRRCRIQRPRRTKYNRSGELGGETVSACCNFPPYLYYRTISSPITTFPPHSRHYPGQSWSPHSRGWYHQYSRLGNPSAPAGGGSAPHNRQRPAVSPPALCSLCGCESPADCRARDTNSRQATGYWVVCTCMPGQSKGKHISFWGHNFGSLKSRKS